jgi:hypothetical protein
MKLNIGDKCLVIRKKYTNETIKRADQSCQQEIVRYLEDMTLSEVIQHERKQAEQKSKWFDEFFLSVDLFEDKLLPSISTEHCDLYENLQDLVARIGQYWPNDSIYRCRPKKAGIFSNNGHRWYKRDLSCRKQTIRDIILEHPDPMETARLIKLVKTKKPNEGWFILEDSNRTFSSNWRGETIFHDNLMIVPELDRGVFLDRLDYEGYKMVMDFYRQKSDKSSSAILRFLPKNPGFSDKLTGSTFRFFRTESTLHVCQDRGRWHNCLDLGTSPSDQVRLGKHLSLVEPADQKAWKKQISSLEDFFRNTEPT